MTWFDTHTHTKSLQLDFDFETIDLSLLLVSPSSIQQINSTISWQWIWINLRAANHILGNVFRCCVLSKTFFILLLNNATKNIKY